VVKIESLAWEKADPANANLEDNAPINGGVRIFPDKLSPTDGTPTIRQQVKLVATITPPKSGVTVYFKVFDVDDPFDQINSTMPSVSLLDATPTTGPDNRPIGQTDAALAALPPATTFLENGLAKAMVTITVSMQPGNNYRASASLIQAALTQTTTYGGLTVDPQQHADALNALGGSWSGYSVPLTWSQMLTAWRKLHVEVDSMSAEPTTVSARNPDWDGFAPIEIADGTATTTFDGVGMAQGGPLAAGEIDHYEGGALSFTVPALDYPVLDNHSYFNSGWGGTRSIIHCNGGTTPGQEADLLAGPAGTVRDDDPISGQLPLLYSVGSDPFILATYRASYIEVVQDDTLNPRRQVQFDLHLEDWKLQTGVGYDNSQDVSSQDAFWSSLVVLSYQPTESIDGDPDMFSGQNNSGPATNPNYDTSIEFGVTIEDSDNASVIYVEVQRDVGSAPASAVAHDLPHTIAHEMGHAAGPPNSPETEHDEGGIMSPGAPAVECCFTAESLRRFREIVRW
jgi:hypothetical protein